MLQDLELGRRTEIDALNGCIAEYGRQLGIPVPVNEVITGLIKARENGNVHICPDTAHSSRHRVLSGSE